jgi:sugar O-acyltransferase (sialic acid O-acetyltransferase NeuD family)
MNSRANQRVAVLGFHDGNAGQVEEWFEEVTGYQIDCFVVERDGPIIIDSAAENKKRFSQKMSYPEGDAFKGHPLICRLDWMEVLKGRGVYKILPLESYNNQRFALMAKARAAGFEFVSAIHPTVTILNQAEIEPGVWINAKSVIGYKAEIKAGVMINTGVIIEHHNVLETCCQVDPGATFGGNVTLRARSHVHMHATIINRIEIGEDAEVGAGAMVRQDIPSKTCYVGVPAKFHRNV